MPRDWDLSKLYPVLRERIEGLLSQAHAEGLAVDVFEAYRSFEEQQERYDRKVTKARPGYSWHQYGLACDLVFKDANDAWSWDLGFDWQRMGELGKGLGLEWGGDWPEFRDLPHFQLCRGMSIHEAYNRYHAEGMADVWLELMRRAGSRQRLSLEDPMLQGTDVVELQWRLSCLEYLDGLHINGVFDEITSAAVREFQRANGLIVDGIVGSQTWAALGSDRALPRPRKPRLGYLKVGIDANRPITPSTGAVEGPSASPHILADTGAHWVRLNFILGPWRRPNDPSRRQGRTWMEVYHHIIESLVNAWDGGLHIYGLIGVEAAHRDPRNLFRFPPADETWALPGYHSQDRQRIRQYDAAHSADVGERPDEWIDHYTDHFEMIVREFSNQIHIFETFNEPDDWHRMHPPGKPEDRLDPWGKEWERAWVHPYWLAKMLQNIHQRVNSLGVKVITGPLQGLGENWHGPADYLDRMYNSGRRLFEWGNGSYPFDGVGYHLYVHEGFNPDMDELEHNIRTTYTSHLNCIEGVIKRYEGQSSDRKLYISEFGWPTPNADSEEEQAFQAHAMETAFAVLKDDPRIASAIWFCTQDFPGKNYGLYRAGALGTATQKRAVFEAYRRCAETEAVAPEEGEPGPPVPFHGAEQPFERGGMIWRGDSGQIIALHEDGTWASYGDTFDPSVDPIITGASPPSEGLQEPAFGIGKVWREQPGVRDRLGWALSGERAFEGRSQRFDWGEKLWGEEEVYLLRNNATWETE